MTSPACVGPTSSWATIRPRPPIAFDLLRPAGQQRLRAVGGRDSSGIVVRPCPQGPSGRRGNGRFFPWDWTSIWCSSKTPSIGRLGPRHPTTWFEKLRTNPPCPLIPQKRTRLVWLVHAIVQAGALVCALTRARSSIHPAGCRQSTAKCFS